MALWFGATFATAGELYRGDVVILHGLARTQHSMDRMARELEKSGYHVCNVSYPSRHYAIDELTADHVLPSVLKCARKPDQPLNFVTHSLGGIIVRQLEKIGAPIVFGRVVMLGPPNKGSEAAEKLKSMSAYRWVNGPAGEELGTDSDSLPRGLGPTRLEVGVIAGNRSVNPILSWLIPGVDDGKVSIESAKLEGMRDFLVVSSSHPFLMTNPEVISQTVTFLQSGCFKHARGAQDTSACSR